MFRRLGLGKPRRFRETHAETFRPELLSIHLHDMMRLESLSCHIPPLLDSDTDPRDTDHVWPTPCPRLDQYSRLASKNVELVKISMEHDAFCGLGVHN